MKHIRIFHNTKSNYEFDLRYRLIDQKWRTWKLTKFSNYFQKQWVKSKLKNWQQLVMPRQITQLNHTIKLLTNISLVVSNFTITYNFSRSNFQDSRFFTKYESSK